MKILALLTFENSIIFAYTLIGFMSLIAYLPQIRTLFKSKSRCRDVSLQSWCVWSVDAMVSLLYAVFILEDIIASLIFSVDFIGAICILGLATSKRLQYGEAHNIRSMRIAEVSRFMGK